MKNLTLYFICAILMVACSKNDDDPENTSSCDTVCSVPLNSGETAGVTPAAIIGTFNLTYHLIHPGGPFSDGDTATAELTTDNKLIFTYKDQCVTAENPFQSSPQEVNFRDNCVFNVIFGASENSTGGLNEINIGSLSFDFYGQFKE